MAEIPTVTVPPPNDWPAVFEHMYLTTPGRRATVAALFAGLVCYTLKPGVFFDEDGKMRMQRIPYLHKDLPGLEQEEKKLTNCHFLIVPALAAAVGGVFV